MINRVCSAHPAPKITIRKGHFPVKTLSDQAYKSRIRIANYICAGIALVLVVLQFIPFWGCYQCDTCGEGKVISINAYIWFAREHKNGLTAVLQNYYFPDFKAMDVVGTSVLMQVASLLALAMSILRPAKLTAPFFALIAGVICVVGYLTEPVYQMGWLWQGHLVAGIVAILAALGVLLFAFCRGYQKAKAAIAAQAK